MVVKVVMLLPLPEELVQSQTEPLEMVATAVMVALAAVQACLIKVVERLLTVVAIAAVELVLVMVELRAKAVKVVKVIVPLVLMVLTVLMGRMVRRYPKQHKVTQVQILK